MAIRAIVTGATGMVGEGVLHECLLSDKVEKVLVIGRKPCGVTHAKMSELIVPDFFNLKFDEQLLKGYNACYFCLGVSSIGMKEPEFFRLTHTLTLNFATLLSRVCPDMVFCYVSGAGTDSSEKGRLMWARVKGKTENDLAKLPFRAVYKFRPGFMKPTKGLKNTLKGYKYLGWLYPIMRGLMNNKVSTLKEVGLAMINVTIRGYSSTIISVKDIIILAKDES